VLLNPGDTLSNPSPLPATLIHTFETRLRVTDEQAGVLTTYCAEWSRGLRIAYAAVNRGEAQPLLYRRLTANGFTSHQAKSLQRHAEAKHKTLRGVKAGELSRRHAAIGKREHALAAKQRELDKLVKRQTKLLEQRAAWAPHSGRPQTKRFRQVLEGLRTVGPAIAACERWIRGKGTVLSDKRAQAGRLAEQLDSGRLPLCFGSAKLLAQRPVAANAATTPFESVEDWHTAWDDARDGQVWSVGDAAVPSGNREMLWDPFAQTLRVRLSDTLARGRMAALSAEMGVDIKHGPQKLSPLRMQCRFLTFADVDFPSHKGFARAAIVAAQGERPVTMRLLRRRLDDGSVGFYLQASVEVADKPPTATRLSGALGVDLNAGGAAWCAVKPDGNRLITADGAQTGFIEWNLRGKTAAQRKAILSEAASELVNRAAALRMALALEALDFAARRSGMAAGARGARERRYNGMLSSFASRQFAELVERKCARAGVVLYKVQPAWSSVGGFVKYGTINHLGADEAASLWLARQALYGVVPRDAGTLRYVKTFHERIAIPHLPVDRKQRKKALAGVQWGDLAQAIGPDRRLWRRSLRQWKGSVVDAHGSGSAAASVRLSGSQSGAGPGTSGAHQAGAH